MSVLELTSEEHLQNAEQNLKAAQSMHDDSLKSLERMNHSLTRGLADGGKVNGSEILASHLQTSPAEITLELERLEDSLESYQELDAELRLQLGRKIARLVPELAHSKKKLVLDHAVKVLKAIATDQDDRIRRMIAQELCDMPDAPYDVIRLLAYDRQARVACPILEFSPLLKDVDLIEIISTSSIPGVAEAIARRSQLSGAVSDAMIAHSPPAAIKLLLENPHAEISEPGLEKIIDAAPEHEIWHESLIMRPELTQRTINRIGGFLSQSLLMKLQDHQALSESERRNLRNAVQSRLSSWTQDQEREAQLTARQWAARGRLDEERVSDAVHAVNEPLVIACLAELTGFSFTKVKRMLQASSPRATVALVWAAGLPMRAALDVQMKIARIHHSRLIYARGGTDYPLAPEEMQTYLEIFKD